MRDYADVADFLGLLDGFCWQDLLGDCFAQAGLPLLLYLVTDG